MKIEKTVSMKIDNVDYNVADFSDALKTLVAFYDDWRQQEVNLKSDILMAQAAIRDITREILQTVQKELAEKAEAEKAAAEAAAVETEEGGAEVISMEETRGTRRQ